MKNMEPLIPKKLMAKLMAVSKIYEPEMDGFKLELTIYVPREVAEDELYVYRRVSEVVKLITSKELTNEHD